MKKIDLAQFHIRAVELIHSVCTSIRPCALSKLKAISGEDSPAAFAASVLCRNAQLASEKKHPLCQDTGYACFFVRFGMDICPFDVASALDAAVKEAYSDGFRLSVADPITRENTNTNTPCETMIEFVPGNTLSVSFLPRGFGAENMTALYMLNPTVGKSGIAEAVLEAVAKAASKPCPPYIVGVGIGGTAELAVINAKKQLMREGKNQDAVLAEMEAELLERINATNIGVQGFGGVNTAFAVNVAKAPTHIAGLPVAVCFECNAVRFGTMEL